MMNNEEFERRMEFIINHQAKFVVDLDELREAHRETEQIVNRLAYVTNVGFKEVIAKIDALVNSQILTDDKIKALADSHKALADSHKDLDASHKQTEEALRKLSATVDRYISNRTNNGTG